jgi:hypothetical protein
VWPRRPAGSRAVAYSYLLSDIRGHCREGSIGECLALLRLSGSVLCSTKTQLVPHLPTKDLACRCCAACKALCQASQCGGVGCSASAGTVGQIWWGRKNVSRKRATSVPRMKSINSENDLKVRILRRNGRTKSGTRSIGDSVEIEYSSGTTYLTLRNEASRRSTFPGQLPWLQGPSPSHLILYVNAAGQRQVSRGPFSFS